MTDKPKRDRQWKPTAEVMLRVCRAIRAGNHTIKQLINNVQVRKHHVNRSLQELARMGCVARKKHAVPGRGFIGWYELLHYPALQVTAEGHAPDPEPHFTLPTVTALDTLSQAWPMPVPPLPKLKGRVVRRLAI